MESDITIIVTGKAEGDVLLKYDSEGTLIGYTHRMQWDQKQTVYFLQRVPLVWGGVKHATATFNGALTFVEQVREVTFQMFWLKYDDMVMSSKKRTLAKWNKMSQGDQIKAYNYITKYFNSLPTGVRKKYAETYLNAELWNN